MKSISHPRGLGLGQCASCPAFLRAPVGVIYTKGQSNKIVCAKCYEIHNVQTDMYRKILSMGTLELKPDLELYPNYNRALYPEKFFTCEKCSRTFQRRQMLDGESCPLCKTVQS